MIRWKQVNNLFRINHSDFLFVFPRHVVKPLDVRILSSRQPLSSGKKWVHFIVFHSIAYPFGKQGQFHEHFSFSPFPRYDLTCQTAGSRPPPTVTWWKDGQLLRRSQETVSLCATCPFIKVILNNLHVRQKNPSLMQPPGNPVGGDHFQPTNRWPYHL